MMKINSKIYEDMLIEKLSKQSIWRGIYFSGTPLKIKRGTKIQRWFSNKIFLIKDFIRYVKAYGSHEDYY